MGDYESFLDPILGKNRAKDIFTGSGLLSINGLTPVAQLLAVASAGSDFNIVSSGATHTFNLPTASALNRGALSSTDWTTFNNKLSSISGQDHSTLINLDFASAGHTGFEKALTFSTGLTRTGDTITTDDTQIVHNNLNGLQGGVSAQYFHLTNAQHTIATQQSTTSQDGYLLSTDWNIFNGKLDNIVEDTTPQLGGNLDAQEYAINNVGDITHNDAVASDWIFRNSDLNKFTRFFGNYGGVDTELLTLDHFNNMVGIGVSAPDGFNKLEVQRTLTTETGQQRSAYMKTVVNNSSSSAVFPQSFRADVVHTGAGDVTGNPVGFISNIINDNSGNMTGRCRGAQFACQIYGSGNVSRMENLFISKAFFDTGSSGSITNLYGIFCQDLTTPIGSGTGTITNVWGLYVEGSSLNNYIEGNLEIGEKLTIRNTDEFNAEFSTAFWIRNSGANTPFVAENYSNDINKRNAFTFVRYGGTESSPSTVLAGSEIFAINMNAYDGSSSLTAGQMKAVVDTVTGVGDISSYITFSTRPDGSSLKEAMRIDKNQNVGIGTPNPTEPLDIARAVDNTDFRVSTYSTSLVQRPRFFFFKSHSDTLGTLSETQDGEDLGRFQASGVNSSSLQAAGSAQINFIQDGAAGATYVPASVAFHTGTNSLGATNLPRLVIRSSGLIELKQTAGASEASALMFEEKDTTPANPTSATEVKMYMKDDKIIFQYNDAGTVRYKFLDLTGVGITWQHSTTSP